MATKRHLRYLRRQIFPSSFFHIIILTFYVVSFSKSDATLHRVGLEECGFLRNNTVIEISGGEPQDEEPPNSSTWTDLNLEQENPESPTVKVCYPMEGLEALSHEKHMEHVKSSMAKSSAFKEANSGLLMVHPENVQGTKYGLVLNMNPCEKNLPVFKIPQRSGIEGKMLTTKPFLMIHRDTSVCKCKCEHLFVTGDVYFKHETIVWVVNGILLQNSNYYCIHHGLVHLTRNKVHTYAINGTYKNTQICEGFAVPHVDQYNVWTSETHPCGKTGFDVSSGSKGSSVCVMKRSSKLQSFDAHKCEDRIKKNVTSDKQKPMIHHLPPSCGPPSTELDPSQCLVRCHNNGLIAIPGSCNMFGRCYFSHRQFQVGYFTLYLLPCPLNHRYDDTKKTCVPGVCITPNEQKRNGTNELEAATIKINTE